MPRPEILQEKSNREWADELGLTRKGFMKRVRKYRDGLITERELFAAPGDYRGRPRK